MQLRVMRQLVQQAPAKAVTAATMHGAKPAILRAVGGFVCFGLHN